MTRYQPPNILTGDGSYGAHNEEGSHVRPLGHCSSQVIKRRNK